MGLHSYHSRGVGYPGAKQRENLERVSYAERLTLALAIVYLTYNHPVKHGLERVTTLRSKKCGLFSYLITLINQSRTLHLVNSGPSNCHFTDYLFYLKLILLLVFRYILFRVKAIIPLEPLSE